MSTSCRPACRRPRVLSFAAAALLSWAVRARAGDDAAPAAGVAFEPGPPAFADVLAKSKRAGKPVFVDFFTQSCGWCKRLDRDVLSRAQTAETMKAFVAVRVDAEAGEGVALAKRYNVRGFPTLLVVDADGREIDRVVGYESADAFNDDMRRILRGEDTIADARDRHAAAPGDPALAVAYGEKLAPSDPAAAAELFASAAASKEAEPLTVLKARLGRIGALADSKRPGDAVGEAEALFAAKADAPVGMIVASLYSAIGAVEPVRAIRFLDAARARATNWSERVSIGNHRIDVEQRGIVAALRDRVAALSALPPDDPNVANLLNDSAWICFRMERNVRQATEWARRAVETSRGRPTTLDTLANLLWLQGACDEAVRLESSAAEEADGAEKREFAGTLAKWKVDLAMRRTGKTDEDGSGDAGEERDEDDPRPVIWMK